MVTRRQLIGAATGAGMLALVPGVPAVAAAGERWTGSTSANGWRIDPSAVATYRVEGAAASVVLRQGPAGLLLLHVARRWHYEIGPVDTGEGGGITGYRTDRTVRAPFESNYLSGTAVGLHPTAYPVGGSEPLWPHHERIVRDILVDCEGLVVWGGDLTPAAAAHFHVAGRPGARVLGRVAAGLDTGRHAERRAQTAGAVADPATPARRSRALSLRRPG